MHLIRHLRGPYYRNPSQLPSPAETMPSRECNDVAHA
jgi:hypothetical protein